MKYIYFLIIISFIIGCDSSKKNEIITLFESNKKEFFEFKKYTSNNFKIITKSDKCYSNEGSLMITFTKKYFKNCFSTMDKKQFEKIYNFLEKYSIESIYLEEDKLILIMKTTIGLDRTNKYMISFYKSSLPESYIDSIIFKKELDENWYYLIEEEVSF